MFDSNHWIHIAYHELILGYTFASNQEFAVRISINTYCTSIGDRTPNTIMDLGLMSMSCTIQSAQKLDLNNMKGSKRVSGKGLLIHCRVSFIVICKSTN